MGDVPGYMTALLLLLLPYAITRHTPGGWNRVGRCSVLEFQNRSGARHEVGWPWVDHISIDIECYRYTAAVCVRPRRRWDSEVR